VVTSFSFEKDLKKTLPTLKRAVPQSWGTSNSTFKMNKVGEITLSFVKYSLSKSVHLTPDIVEYDAGATAPLYDLIIGKQTLHDIGAVLDFKEKTITIDGILLPMRNIVNLQLKPSVTRRCGATHAKLWNRSVLRQPLKGLSRYSTLIMTKQIFQQ